ncbi:MAG TPA: magnesium transporter CorA family protein [Xanthomonadales bacterium]|nr:magnesium transporter CorA family protein [Xanthomonadales bacterium]
MITIYNGEQGRLQRAEFDADRLADVIWIDLLHPTAEEELWIEQLLNVDVPTLEEMEEIEISSRLYSEGEAAFMTATLPEKTDTDEPHLAPVTFVLAGERLITVRYHEPRAFHTLPIRAARVAMGCNDGACVLVALLEAQVDRLADVLERGSREIAELSRQVFKQPGGSLRKNSDYQSTLETIGRKGDLTSNIRECLVSLERMLGFLAQTVQQKKSDKDLRARIRTLSRDCQSLTDHSGFMTQKITFLLDALLGLINIEQNAIIKIFSVAAVAFLPPTLIASIYGMNFEVMPELGWMLGYPFALVLMLVSAVVPFFYFKWRRWL